MVLVQKWPFFKLFFKSNIGKENVFHNTLERKNAFLAYKNKKFKRSKNWHFSKGVNPWFKSENGHFSNFFLGNVVKEKVFYDILERKHAFLGYKKKGSLKSRKSDIFPEGLTNGLGPKRAIFRTFFFRQYRPGKCLLRYPRTKKRLSRL